MYEFIFNGGLRPAKAGMKYQFLLFLLIGGKEVPFWEAKRQELVSPVKAESIFAATPNAWSSGCKHLKLFVQEQEFGKPRFMYSFYLELGGGIDRRSVEITPLKSIPKAFGWRFEAHARFLTTKEAAAVLDPSTLGYKLLSKTAMPPRETLKRMITIKKPKAAIDCNRTRKLRVR
jgi:hypothetical protein